MAKPSAERLLLANYPVQIDIPPRFGDLDALRHLNNVAIARIYEDARVRFLNECGGRDAFAPKHRFVMAELTVQYLAEGGYPEVLTAGSGVARLGGSSLVVAQGLFQGGRCIGTSESVLVYVDRTDGRAKPLPEAARAVFGRWMLPGVAGA
jgi:acyl-CoA thioester hydrolase